MFYGDEHVALEVTWSAYQNNTRRLPRARHERGQSPDASRNQHTHLHARTEGPDRAHHAGHDTHTPSWGHSGLHQTTPTPQTNPPKPSTAASNTYAHLPQDLQNPTHCITRALLETSGFKHQPHPNYEEPVNALENAVQRHGNVAGCIVHSDRCSQLRARSFVNTLDRHHLIGSMGQVGAAGNNAAMDPASCFSRRTCWTVSAGAPAKSYEPRSSHGSRGPIIGAVAKPASNAWPPSNTKPS